MHPIREPRSLAKLASTSPKKNNQLSQILSNAGPTTNNSRGRDLDLRGRSLPGLDQTACRIFSATHSVVRAISVAGCVGALVQIRCSRIPIFNISICHVENETSVKDKCWRTESSTRHHHLWRQRLPETRHIQLRRRRDVSPILSKRRL